MLTKLFCRDASSFLRANTADLFIHKIMFHGYNYLTILGLVLECEVRGSLTNS